MIVRTKTILERARAYSHLMDSTPVEAIPTPVARQAMMLIPYLLEILDFGEVEDSERGPYAIRKRSRERRRNYNPDPIAYH